MDTNSYIVTITPRVQTPVGNYFKLAPVTYEIPGEFVGVLPIEFPSEVVTHAPQVYVNIPSNISSAGGLWVVFEVAVRNSCTPQGTVESVVTEGIQAIPSISA